MSTPIANAAAKLVVVIGAGPGTGYSIARRFAVAGHPVALLARREERVTSLADEINALKSAGKARGYGVDTSSEESVSAAFQRIAADFPDAQVWGGVFNANGFLRAPLLETSIAQVRELIDVSVIGAFIFAKAVLSAIQSAAAGEDGETRGFLAFTGATASVKGSANFAAFAAGKFALRALAQSSAREWGPKGVHVFHTIVDGVIDTEVTRPRFDGMVSTFMQPDAIAEAYYAAAAQPRSVWTHELDMRPFDEKF